MKKFIFLVSFLCLTACSLSAATYYVATNGSDTNPGTISEPFATINKVQSVIAAGDTAYFRGGTYTIQESQIMATSSPYKRVFVMNKSGTTTKKTCYWGYPGERPVFDLSQVNPTGFRVTVFYVSASDLHFKNFEIVGTKVNITTSNTQSECIRHDGGNRNIYENLAMHDGMGIGFYLDRGLNNLVLNCDAYNNYDPISQSGGGINGGNVDGFGGHTSNSAGSTGNVFRGCRAWYNSDDGFDLIGCLTAFTIENCWAFNNGYKPPSYGNRVSAGDGTGIKAGGYGMAALTTSQQTMVTNNAVPRHIVKNSLAYYNKNRGIYSNHHLGGITLENNTSYRNPHNYDMTNRQRNADPNAAVDVAGYDHDIKNNVSYLPRTTGRDIWFVDQALSTIQNNSFLPTALTLSDADFMSLDEAQLTAPRKADGSLPYIDFLRAKNTSQLLAANMGYLFEGPSLPVYFDAMSARLKNGVLIIDWTTTNEKNNSYFDIEVSKDSTDFVKIGNMASLAPDGVSDIPLQYHFESNMQTAMAFGAMAILGFVFGIGKRSRKNKRSRLAMLLVLISVVSIYSCTKNDITNFDKKKDVFVRLKQVDKDGSFTFSQVVKVIIE
ncbi:MAG TPA: right-handed parallel beta-helix repeat-containing protein [Niabella sp.]|nr:right-handed parallel beta-helix repeat-containing protein [Niabella sp.]HOZ97883.1 right-handed parallel beta-helix repeat-containing protein [Niabella sp.]HQW13742.1 right-handed parallel beta-helix repeat-containing protein [Niabella sp.]HQX19137.1 right-handed parallel beta-helix repeat-containing protein [Niabella sp.]HQX42050.1 right-handed parallel beta-helix repeat-containing protein [Niabella sp.]